jgi:hypothetical protein
MTTHTQRISLATLLLAAGVSGSAHASVQIFFNQSAWVSAVGGPDQITTLDFVSQTPMFIPSDYYAEFGVLFPEGDEGVSLYIGPSGDGWGMFTINNTITMDLTSPRTHLAIETNATLYQLRLFRQGVLQSQVWVFGPFTGILSAQPFDRAILINTGANGVNIDNLHFGGIPSPCGLAVLVATTLLGGRGRRRRIG